MDTNFYNIPKIPKVPIFVANKDDVIIYRNDAARVKFSAGKCGTHITNLIDKTDISRYNALVDNYSGADKKGVFRLVIGSKRQTAIFEQHLVDSVILRVFILLSGEYSALKELYETSWLDASMEDSLTALHNITEDTLDPAVSADDLAHLYSQLFGAKFLLYYCFGFTKTIRSTVNIPYRFMGFVDFWISHMISKTRQIDCDITTDFAPGINESDYVSTNPCGLLLMMTALAAYLCNVSSDQQVLLSASKRAKSYFIEISSNVDVSIIAQHSSNIDSLAHILPNECLNLLLAFSVSKQCGFGLSYSTIGTQPKRLAFSFVLNDIDIGTLGFKAHTPGDIESTYINAAKIIFLSN